MTPDELLKKAEFINGGKYGCLARLGQKLGVRGVSVKRWASGTHPIPPAVAKEIDEMVALLEQKDGARCRDEWLFATGSTAEAGRNYLIHTSRPAFRARVIQLFEDGGLPPDEEPCNHSYGLTEVKQLKSGRILVLCEIEWLDDADPSCRPEVLLAALNLFN